MPSITKINTLEKDNRIQCLYNIPFTISNIKFKKLVDKRREKCDPYPREKTSIETHSEMRQMLTLTDEDFKAAIMITITKNSKETIIGMSKHGESQQRNENHKN